MFFISNAIAKEKTRDKKIADELNERVWIENKKLPIMVSKVLRKDYMSSKSKEITHFFTYLKLKKENINLPKLEAEIREFLFEVKCQNPIEKKSRAMGVTSVYKYSDKFGKPLTKIIIAPDDCIDFYFNI
jgi:hypothetical protein